MRQRFRIDLTCQYVLTTLVSTTICLDAPDSRTPLVIQYHIKRGFKLNAFLHIGFTPYIWQFKRKQEWKVLVNVISTLNSVERDSFVPKLKKKRLQSTEMLFNRLTMSLKQTKRRIRYFNEVRNYKEYVISNLKFIYIYNTERSCE